MVYNFIRKKLRQSKFSCKFSEIFEKTFFVEHIRADVWMRLTKKNCV